MKKLNFIFFASNLHDNASVLNSRQPLMEGIKKFAEINIVYPSTLSSGQKLDKFIDGARKNPSEGLSHTSDCKTVCFIGTGGTEEMFRSTLPMLPEHIILLSDGFHNSFAASLEIKTFLTQKGISCDLYNAPLDYNTEFFTTLEEALFSESEATVTTQITAEEPQFSKTALKALEKKKIGLIGGASPWLISSDIDRDYVQNTYKVEFLDIAISELENAYEQVSDDNREASDIVNSMERFLVADRSREDLEKAARLYVALNAICKKYSLDAMTIKCFDILASTRTTACLALGLLNDHGIVAGCEGDIPTLWTMIYAQTMFGKKAFMANPSSSSATEQTIDFAHCTIPMTMLHGYRLPSHFESQIGIGIAGSVPSGEYRLIKISGSKLDRMYSVVGDIIMNTNVPQRCRTQIRFKFRSKEDFDSFTKASKGNHIVLIPA